MYYKAMRRVKLGDSSSGNVFMMNYLLFFMFLALEFFLYFYPFLCKEKPVIKPVTEIMCGPYSERLFLVYGFSELIVYKWSIYAYTFIVLSNFILIFKKLVFFKIDQDLETFL